MSTRPLYWSVRRELWENRSIYLAPLAMALVSLPILVGSALYLPIRLRHLAAADVTKAHAALIHGFEIAPMPVMLVAMIVAVFYCLDALYGERRERSILFWKSLPVSDTATVLSKAAIPLVILPLIAFAIAMSLLLLLLFVTSGSLAVFGENPARLWNELHIVQDPILGFWHLFVHICWLSPLFAWLLLISAWARRAPVLWAFVPPAAIAAVEWMLFHTKSFLHLIGDRFMGGMTTAFRHGEMHSVADIDILGFLAAPGLWAGFIFAALCLAAAIRLRRYREPI
jgi:ABC-2 type transport system permease protein